jgi:synaptic vesicle membrane protein VAT-1
LRQIVIPRFGGPEVLSIREALEPAAGPGEVSIRVVAAGINFVDLQTRMGLFPDAPRPPLAPGYEVSGVVERAEDVDGIAPGDRVLAMTRLGGYSEVVVAPREKVRKIPENMSFEEAAALPVVYLTAHHALITLGNLQKNQRVLIHSAGGALGTAAIQVARSVGAVTFGTASARKHDALRKRGLQHALDYRDYDEEVRRQTGGRGVHYIIDPLGGRNWRKNYRLLAPSGRMCVVGFSDISPGSRFPSLPALLELLRAPRFRPLQFMNDNRGVLGVKMVGLWDEPEVFPRSMEAVLALYAQDSIRPVVDRVFSFSEAAAAHRYIHERRNFGKVLLKPE